MLWRDRPNVPTTVRPMTAADNRKAGPQGSGFGMP